MVASLYHIFCLFLIYQIVFILANKVESEPPYDNKLRKVEGQDRWDALLKPPFESSHASFIENFLDATHTKQDSSSSISKVMAWFSGSAEGQSGVAIVVSYFRSFTDHLTKEKLLQQAVNQEDSQVVGEWTDAVVVSQFEGYSNQNPVLYQEVHSESTYDHTKNDDHSSSAPIQDMHLFHTRQIANQGEDNATVWYLHLDQNKMEWSTPIEVFSKPQGSFVRNRIVNTELDELILPFYYEADYEHSNLKLLPDNKQMTDGSKWQDIEFPISEMGDGTTYMIQPSIVPLQEKGEYVAYFRDTASRNIYESYSKDYGHSWTKPKPNVLPNNNSGIQAFRLNSGRLAMVYNPTHTTRDPLVISLSEDDGQSWKYTRVLEEQDGQQEFSYPSLVQEENYNMEKDNEEEELIHISYTWKRQTIKHSIVTENWIMEVNEQY